MCGARDTNGVSVYWALLIPAKSELSVRVCVCMYVCSVNIDLPIHTLSPASLGSKLHHFYCHLLGPIHSFDLM